MTALIQKLLKHNLVQNIFALYGVQFASYIFPLLTIPYLTRVLGPKEWGLVAFTQAFGQYMVLIVEYGFSLSATREIARFRDSVEKRSELLAGVIGAKLLLAFLSLVLALVVSRWITAFQEHPRLFWSGIFWAYAMAFNLMWYFQGLERMRLVATLDVGAKALALIGIVLWVRTPQDGWKVLALMGAASLISGLTALFFAYSEVPARLPNWRFSREALRLGWTMFLFRSAVSLYTVGNTFILGLFVQPQIVGYYAGAEKISKAFLGLLGPITQAIYPRMSQVARRSQEEAAKLARAGIIAMGFGGVFIGVVVFASAPLLVRVLLGEGFQAAVPVLRILALLLPMIAISNVLGIQWMLPLGLDRPFNAIILSAGLINMILALILAPRYAHIGMAWSVVLSEAFATSCMYAFLHRREIDPFQYKKIHAGKVTNDES